MTMEYYSARSPVLFTGAGFSKPFGGYLASEMWSIIFNQLKTTDSQRLRELLLDDLNYERVYDRILTREDFSSEEKAAFTDALENAYGELDQSIRLNFANQRWHAQTISYFISKFCGEARTRGFVFTLNQGLLLERFYSNNQCLPQIPGLGHPDWFIGRFDETSPPKIIIPEAAKIASLRQNFWANSSGLQNLFYIKLHGSYGWRSPQNTNILVVGYEKAGSIEKEPLLAWYLEIFREVLSLPNQTLVVIGYRFRDRHINDIIVGAAESGLKLHVISPVQPRDFKEALAPIHSMGSDAAPRGHEIWKMLYGYHCATIESLLPNNLSALPGPTEALFRHTGLD